MRGLEVRRLRLSHVLSLAFALWIVASTEVAAFEYALDASAGAFWPWEIDHREIYGSGMALGLGFSPRLPDKDAWILLDVGLVRSQGRMPTVDPTFMFPEETYVLVPLLVGIRGNPFATDPPSRVKLYFGMGVASLLTWWKREGQNYVGTPTVGLALEVRPEIRLGDQLGLWIRNRLTIMPSVRYRDSGLPDLNYSGNTLQAGISYFVE